PAPRKIALAMSPLMLTAARPEPASAASNVIGTSSPAFGDRGPATTSMAFGHDDAVAGEDDVALHIAVVGKRERSCTRVGGPAKAGRHSSRRRLNGGVRLQ